MIQIIEYQSQEYLQSLELRQKILRKPLGLDIYNDPLQEEIGDIHMAYFHDSKLIGIILLRPQNTVAKMRQVAIDDSFQGKGIGQELVRFFEQYAKEKGFTEIQLHARATAVPFYQKLGYEVVGDTFTEVGIPHFAMQKSIVS